MLPEVDFAMNGQRIRSSIDLVHRDMNIQFVIGNKIYATNDHLIFTSDNYGLSWQRIGRLPLNKESIIHFIKDVVLRSALVRKVRRNIGPNNLVVLNSGTVIIFYDKIYRIGAESSVAVPIWDLKKKGLHGPMLNGICITPDDEIYWGEYNCQKDQHSISVIKGLQDGREWKVCYGFRKGVIGHIHSMRYDPYRKKVLICTGDMNHESNIFYWDDNLKKLLLLGGGDQGWRAVSIIPTETALFWGSDAGKNNPDDAKNYIFKYDFQTGNRSIIQGIENPVYFSAIVNDSTFIITTTYEGQRENEPYASIWGSVDGLHWETFLRLRYKQHRYTGSNFGIIRIPSGINDTNSIFYTPFNLEGHFNLYSMELA